MYFFEVFGYLFVVLASIGSMIAASLVNSTFRKYSAQISSMGITGAEAARRVMEQNGVFGVRVERVSGNLTDHYDPRDNTVYLSDSVYDSKSTAAIGVASHEAGHAVQHAKNYVPVRIRTAIVPIANIGTKLSVPMILIGLLLSGVADFPYGYPIAMAGVLFFGLSVVFQLVTLPTELDASHRAMSAIREGNLLVGEELVGARKTLTAAAMTYVAALAYTLLQFLRLLALVSGGRRRR